MNKIDGHIWLITPRGEPFFSIGLNHIDPASLRYPENIHIWQEKYNLSTAEWLRNSVKLNLEAWGFNTMGWEQEAIYEAIRRYDPNHLILGDRYEANAPISIEVIEAALTYVDVLSFQDFKGPKTHLEEWQKKQANLFCLLMAQGL